MKNNLKIFSLLLILVLLLIFPEPVINATKTGLFIWADKVIPSLFPFFVLTRLMIHYQVPQLIGKILAPVFKHLLHISPITFFIMLMSVISGNPSGAKMAREYYDQKLITKREFQGLLYFCNFSSPLFILGTIGVILYQSSTVGYLLLASHLLGSLAVFICCYPYFKNNHSENIVEIKVPTQPFSALLIDSIESTIQTLIRVGGIIMFFYIVSAIFNILQIFELLNLLMIPLLSFSNITNLEPFFSGILEFTQGVSKIADSNLPLNIQLALTAFIVSFVGLSIHTQIFMFADNSGISYFKYLMFRFLHGWASALIVLFGWRFVLTDVRDVFSPFETLTEVASFSISSLTIGIIGFYLLLKIYIGLRQITFKKINLQKNH